MNWSQLQDYTLKAQDRQASGLAHIAQTPQATLHLELILLIVA